MLQNQDNEFGHNHCVSCIRLHCKERNACKVIACKLACGMQYHECKDDEHVNLCPNVKVLCINNVNGCPLLLPRNQLGIHLENCPASVVCCTMEWNRWPMYSRERRQRIPFSETNVHARYGQLDVALALRDQRVLDCALKMPGRHRALRNMLTKKYPAMPFVDISDVDKQQESDGSEVALLHTSDDESDAPWHVAKNPPGLQRSIYNGLFWSARRAGAANSLSATLNLLMADVDVDYVEQYLMAEEQGLLDRADDVPAEAAASRDPAENAFESEKINKDLHDVNCFAALNVPEDGEQPIDAIGNSNTMDVKCRHDKENSSHCHGDMLLAPWQRSISNDGANSSIGACLKTDKCQCSSSSISPAGESLQTAFKPCMHNNNHADGGEVLVESVGKNEEATHLVVNGNEDCVENDSSIVREANKADNNPRTYEDAFASDELSVSKVNEDFDGVHAFVHKPVSVHSSNSLAAAAVSNGSKDGKTSVVQLGHHAASTYHNPQIIQSAFVISVGNAPKDASASSATSSMMLNSQSEGLNALRLDVNGAREECKEKDGYQSVYTNETANGCKHVSWYQVAQVPSSPEAVKLQNILGLDLSLELLPCYQTKPQAMYTFRCAQVFRRHEFPWHFQNVHGDIHSGLDGWLEYRCPLANCGCTYSQRRFRPDGPRSSVVYSVCRESFAVVKERSKSPCRKLPHLSDQKPSSSESEVEHKSMTEMLDPTSNTNFDVTHNTDGAGHLLHEGTPDMFTSVDYDSPVNLGARKVKTSASNSLLSLPLEVLRHIAALLDSFSLGCLALTCHQLRDVCSSLLQDHGMVVMTWKRHLGDGGRSRWTIDGKKWLFSTAFNAVPRWQFEDNVHMNEHLKVCPFMQRIVHTQPIKLAGMREAATQFSSPHPDVARVISRINKYAAMHGPLPADDDGSSIDYSQF